MMFLGHNNLASFVSWSTILAVLLLPAAVFGQQHQDVDVASQMEALAASFEGAFLPAAKSIGSRRCLAQTALKASKRTMPSLIC